MKKETDFIQEQDTPKFADVFFELFIALVPFFFISLISYLPIQLPLLGLCMFWFYRSTEKLQSVLITLSFIQSFFLNLLFFAILATWGNMYRVYGFSGRLSLPFLFGISSYIIATWPVLTRREKTITKLRKYPYFNWYWGVSCFLILLCLTE